MNIFKRLFCKHEWKVISVWYGDAIAMHNYMRSRCKCIKCGKEMDFPAINPIDDKEE